MTRAAIPACASASSLRAPNVSLVTAGIDRITPTGVRTAGGAIHDCDVIMYGTGFAATAFLVPLRVEGRAGLVLADEWRDGAYAYLSMAVPGFSILDS